MEANQQHAPARILVVDDEPSIVDAIATALRYEGYEVEEVSTGRDALAAAARHEPDLVAVLRRVNGTCRATSSALPT